MSDTVNSCAVISSTEGRRDGSTDRHDSVGGRGGGIGLHDCVVLSYECVLSLSTTCRICTATVHGYCTCRSYAISTIKGNLHTKDVHVAMII